MNLTAQDRELLRDTQERLKHPDTDPTIKSLYDLVMRLSPPVEEEEFTYIPGFRGWKCPQFFKK